MDWQPIETAPKDGAWILLFCPERRRQGDGFLYKSAMVVAQWDAHHMNIGETMDGHRFLDEEDDGAFVAPLSDGFERAVYQHFTRPTHWMPLPEPPTSSV